MKQQMDRSDIEKAISSACPEYSSEQVSQLSSYISSLLEGKDLGTFKGEVSVFKQRAAAGKKPTKKQEKDARKKLDKLVSKLEKRLAKLVKDFKGGGKGISKTRFRESMRTALKAAYEESYILGTRSRGLGAIATHLGVDERKWLDNIFAQEQKYFNKFIDSVIKGESKKKTAQRINSYSQAVKSVFEASKVLQIPEDSLIYWVLESDNPCPDCRLLHRMSPFTRDTLPTTPKAGSTRCLARCYCRLRIVKGTPAKIAGARRRVKSAKDALKKLQWNRKHVKK